MPTPTIMRARRRALVQRAGYTSLLILLAALLPLARPASAGGVITVDTLTDKSTRNFDGIMDDGLCSLREAIQAADTNLAVNGSDDCPAGNGADTIKFSVAGTINLKVGGVLDDPDGMYVNSEITIQGPIIISGQNGTRIFRLTSGGILKLNQVTLQNAFTGGSGAAILAYGGEIHSFGSSFVNNKASFNGGAIDSDAKLSMLATNFSGNTAGGEGGAIRQSTGYYHSKIALSNFAGNISGGSGGAIYNNSHLLIEDSIFSGNIVTTTLNTSGGGAIYNYFGEEGLHIQRSAFNGNLANNGGSGGALANNVGATAIITDTSFNGNIAGDSSNGGNGGGVANWGEMLLVRTAFNANLVTNGGHGGGLINNTGKLNIANSSFFANAAGGNGGGIYNADFPSPSSVESTSWITNSTIFGNQATGNGGGIYNSSEEIVKLKNTIVASNSLGGNCFGPITSRGHNIDSGNSCNLLENGDGDMINENPSLEAPKYNGGAIASLFTQKLLDDSPAIDAGDNAACSGWPVNNKDQRDESRPNNGDGAGAATCDIGAFEGGTAMPGFGSDPTDPGPITFGNSQVGQPPITTTLRIFEAGKLPLTVSSIGISGAHAGDFTVLSGTSFVIPDGGADKKVVLQCQATAAGARSAKLNIASDDPGNALVTFDLSCNGIAANVPAVAGYSSTPQPGTSISFGNVTLGSNRNRSIEVQESGNATLTVSNPVISGPNSAEFSMITNMSAFSIANNGPPKSITVRCTPAEPGIRTATLTLSSNDPTRPSVAYDMSCTGTPPPSPLIKQTDVEFDNINGINPSHLEEAYAVIASPDGKHVYVTSAAGNSVMTFNIQSNGTLSYLNERTSAYTTNLSGPRKLAISPEGKHIYIAGYESDSIGAYSRNASSGLLTLVEAEYDTSISRLAGAFDVVISPDGKHIYVSGGDDHGMNTYARNQDTGAISRIQSFTNGGQLARMYDPRGIAISPDGNNVYVTSPTSDTLLVFDRNPSTGLLGYASRLVDNVSGVDGLDDPYDVAVSPDGARVYVASRSDDALVVFDRDPADGSLTYNHDIENGLFLTALNNPYGVEVSPDGQYVYLACGGSNTLAVFRWDSEDQRLELAEVHAKGLNGVTGLGGPRQVATSPDGKRIYATGVTDNSISVFTRVAAAPQISSLSPGSIAEDSPGLTLEVNGANFTEDSVVRWNGLIMQTGFINSGQLQAQIPASYLSTAGTKLIRVSTSAPGGGTSSDLEFKVIAPDQNPVPSLLEISPPSVMAGSEAFTLIVDGTSFLPGSKVQWNGVNLTTTYVNSTRLSAAVPKAKLTTPGMAGVRVFTPAPGGGTSSALSFTIVEAGSNPVPAIDKLTPNLVIARGADSQSFKLVIQGVNFTQDSVVRWNGQSRATTFINSTRLEVTILASDIAMPGKGSIAVFTPAPGGGSSNTETLFIGYESYVTMQRR